MEIMGEEKILKLQIYANFLILTFKCRIIFFRVMQQKGKTSV